MPEHPAGLLRCPRCGAANPADASWCGQCHARFSKGVATSNGAAPEPSPPEMGSVTATPFDARGGEPTWTCPACEAANRLDASSCERCGTPFGALLSSSSPVPAVRVTRERAIALSAALPGLGHWALRRAGEAAARAVLYVWTVGIAVLLLLRPPAPASAVVRGVGAIFALSAAAVWLLSMLETMRLVGGDRRGIVPPKALTWLALALSVILVMGLLGSALAGRSA